MVADQLPHNPLTYPLFEEEADEILEKELARSYTILYKIWVTTSKINEENQGQVHQISQDNETLEKKVATLKREILKNSMDQF